MTAYPFFVAPAKGGYFGTINPATEKKLAEVASATAEDVDRAVRAARRAYDKSWSKLPGTERGKYIYRIARLLQERAREFQRIDDDVAVQRCKHEKDEQ